MTNTATAALPETRTTTWNIDPVHSMAEFKVKHMMIAHVKGQFPKVSGALLLDESDLANSRVEASIGTASIHTRDEQRDSHLKSADFFDDGSRVSVFRRPAFRSREAAGPRSETSRARSILTRSDGNGRRRIQSRVFARARNDRKRPMF